VRHTPVYEKLSLLMHDLTEGFMALVKTRSDYLALICMSLARNYGVIILYVAAREWYPD
jgi:hypothetical protein